MNYAPLKRIIAKHLRKLEAKAIAVLNRYRAIRRKAIEDDLPPGRWIDLEREIPPSELTSDAYPVMVAYWKKGEDIGTGELGVHVGEWNKIDPWSVPPPHVAETVRDMTTLLSRSLYRTTQDRIDRATLRIKDEIRQGLLRGDSYATIGDAIRNVFGRATQYQADTIAKTEGVRAINGGSVRAYRESGVCVGVEWLLSGNPCPQCIAVSIETGKRSFTEHFTRLDGVREEYAIVDYPPLHPRCQCGVMPIIGDVVREDTRQPSPVTDVEGITFTGRPTPFGERIRKELAANGVANNEKRAIAIGRMIEEKANESLAKYNKLKEKIVREQDEVASMMRKASRSKSPKLRDQLPMIEAKYKAIDEKRRRLEVGGGEAKIYSSILQQVRDFGPEKGKLPPYSMNAASECADAAKYAASLFPRDWWKKSSEYVNDLEIHSGNAGEGAIGQYTNTHPSGNARILIATDKLNSGPSRKWRINAVMTHEMAHRMEKANPEIAKMEWEFLNRRSQGRPTARAVIPGYGPIDIADAKLPDDYSMRVYSRPTIFEVFSRAMESIVDSNVRIDQEQLRLALGMLAGAP